MRKLFLLQFVILLSLRALADPTFATRQVPINRGGQDGGTVSLRFYSDMPSVPYISVADFQALMLPGTTIGVTKTGEGAYTLKGPFAEAMVDTSDEKFTSADYMGFTNLMGQFQEGMANVYYDGAPFVRYRSQELTPSSVTVTFDFKKYGIDLRGDDAAVYFPFATLSDLYSDLYYHIAGYNGEKVIVVTENQNASIAKLDPEGTVRVLQTESRSEDMAAYSYGELCFVVDHFYGLPGRSPIEESIRTDGLDKALDVAEYGPTIKQLLKSTDMLEYMFGMDCLQLLFQDGGHTNVMVDVLASQTLSEIGVEAGNGGSETSAIMMDKYPELFPAFQSYLLNEMFMSPKILKARNIQASRPTAGTYFKEGDTAYLLFNSFGATNEAAWQAYYDGGCQGDLPALDPKFEGDLTVVLDALQQASDDPEVKNFVVDLTANFGGSLDVVMAMTALMGQQSHFYSENVLTGQRQIISYDVDSNFDGQFDERDKQVKYDLNFAVLTSDLAFSCGNLFPSLMKDMGFPIIGERTGGGACAIQYFITPEGLQYQLSSARARLTDDKWQNIDGGVEPDYAIDVSAGDYSAFYDVAAISDIISKENAEGDMATTITASGLYTDGDVTLDVTKTADGSIQLYDQKRNIYTKNCATLTPLDELVEQGTFFDYIKDTGDMTAEEVIQDMANITSNKNFDITAYVNSAENASAPDGQLYAYRLKSITIEQMTKDGKDYMPAGGQPIGGVMVKMSYIDRPWVQLHFGVVQGMYTAPFTIDSDMMTQQSVVDLWKIIPREGVTMEILALRDTDKQFDDPEADVARFTVNVIPDATGSVTVEKDGLKMTVSYERTGSHLADIHWGMARTYDFFKNVFGRNSYDGKGAPIYNMTYLPGGAFMWDDSFPHFFFEFSQNNAMALKRYTPNLMLYGTGGYAHLDNTTLRPVTELSVMCHEFTHLVNNCTAKLPTNLAEGNALNESFSDVMSISMMKTADYGYGPETPWVIGGKSLIIGKDYLRNLADPKTTGHPDTYQGDNWNNLDVYNMGAVQNYFYYLLCDGGKGTNDNSLNYDVTGIGVEKGTQIAYLTLTKYCNAESDYSNIRDSWLKAAQELYGENSTEAQTVAKAWTAVGIEGPDITGIEEIGNGKAANSKWYTLDGRQLLIRPAGKGVYIHDGKKRIIK